MDSCQNQAFLDVLLESVNDAVTGIDKEGTVLYWNQVAEQLYGIPKEQIIGRKVGEFFQKGSVMLYQIMETGNPVHQVYHKPRPDKHVFITAVPIYDKKGILIGAISVEQDITDKVKLSEELYVKAGSPYRFPLDHQSLLENSSLQQINQFLRQVNEQSYPVLLLGESGVGKEAFAKMIQQNSKRSGAFLVFNCSTLPKGLIESELFGYQGGLFGGQAEESPGKLDLAGNGVIYLMNIQALPLSTQSKLVTAIREKHYFRVGGSQPVPLKCQIIASAPPDLQAMVANGEFMQDLFYSFHAQSIPPLRDRREELPELCHLFLTESAKAMGKPVPRLSSEVMAALTTYSWPGNFPQMRNLMERLVLLSDDRELTLSDLPPELQLKTLSNLAEDSLSLTSLSEAMEKTKIEDVLKRTGGNKSSAARLLGISRGSLYYKIKQYGIREDEHA